MSEEKAADVLFTLIDPSIYADLVLASGWSDDEFRQWVVTIMEATLLPSPRGAS